MRQLRDFLLYWLPPLLFMLFIFLLSSQPRLSVTGQFLFDFVIFKTLHIVEYAILYFLLARAFLKTTAFQVSGVFLYSFLVAFFYAIIDEVHQTFIPTREGKLRDVAIDALGIYLTYLFLKNKLKLIRRCL